jgi:hypothetical protein
MSAHITYSFTTVLVLMSAIVALIAVVGLLSEFVRGRRNVGVVHEPVVHEPVVHEPVVFVVHELDSSGFRSS